VSPTVSISAQIIEGLYCEALVLSDEIRSAFESSSRSNVARTEEDQALIALSCESLRTTARMMHGMAWLLNHRAYLRGEMSSFQLHRQGRLVREFPEADIDRLKMLPAEMGDLIRATEVFYARLVRLDNSWFPKVQAKAAPFDHLRERLALAVNQ
jgi:regulator of CtrA degradation